MLLIDKLMVVSVAVVTGSDNYAVHAAQIDKWLETNKLERGRH